MSVLYRLFMIIKDTCKRN